MKKNLLSVAILILGIAVSSCTDKLQEAPNMPLNPNLKSESGFQASLNLEKSFISTRSSESTPIYPDYYGGGYISDKDELVVLVKKGFNKENAKIEFQNRSKSSNILTKECDYSFNELMELNTKLSNIFCSNNNLVNDLGWFSVGVLPIENRISVCLFDCSENNIKRFKSEISDSPMIIFEEISNINYDTEIQESTDSITAKEKATSKTNVHAGSQINRIGKATNNKGEIIDAILNGSVGFRVMVGNDHGFITAAHNAPETGMKFNFGSTKNNLGKVTKTAISQKVDAAFVSVDYEKYYPTNVTQWSKTTYQSKYLITNNFLNSIANQSMIVEGQSTKKAIKIKVYKLHNTQTSKGFSSTGKPKLFPVEEVVYANFTVPSDTTKTGDSGGIVYTQTGAYLGGIHIGKATVTGTQTRIEMFSSAEHALKALGASLSWVK